MDRTTISAKKSRFINVRLRGTFCFVYCFSDLTFPPHPPPLQQYARSTLPGHHALCSSRRQPRVLLTALSAASCLVAMSHLLVNACRSYHISCPPPPHTHMPGISAGSLRSYTNLQPLGYKRGRRRRLLLCLDRGGGEHGVEGRRERSDSEADARVGGGGDRRRPVGLLLPASRSSHGRALVSGADDACSIICLWHTVTQEILYRTTGEIYRGENGEWRIPCTLTSPYAPHNLGFCATNQHSV